MQARGCRAKRFKKLIETDPWRIANTIKYAFREASFSGSNQIARHRRFEREM